MVLIHSKLNKLCLFFFSNDCPGTDQDKDKLSGLFQDTYLTVVTEKLNLLFLPHYSPGLG